MPMRKLCPRCQAVIALSEQYCPKCREQAEQDRLYRQSQYRQRAAKNNKKNINNTDVFYNSTRWRRVSKAVIAGHYGVDVYQYHLTGRIEAAEVVHHIVPVKEDWDKRWAMDNLIPISLKSHMAIEAEYRSDGEAKARLQGVLVEALARFHGAFRRGGGAAEVLEGVKTVAALPNLAQNPK